MGLRRVGVFPRTCSDFGIYLDPRVGWNPGLGKFDALVDRDSGCVSRLWMG